MSETKTNTMPNKKERLLAFSYSAIALNSYTHTKDWKNVIKIKWTDRELNPRPLPVRLDSLCSLSNCQGSDLPLIYRPIIFEHTCHYLK